MKEWSVYVLRDAPPYREIYLGTVFERNEELARLAALSKFGMSEDEYFEAEESGVEYPLGITAFDDFVVREV